MPPTEKVSGFWGYPTSTLDWCEENYAVSPFIAEFWNTTSNWIMIFPPLIAAMLAYKDKLELRIWSGFLMLSIVGLGSFMFHCTLLYEMQLLDELPMIYGSCIMLYCLLTYRTKENSGNNRLILTLTAVSMFITIIYVTVPNPLVFQWCYGILAGTIFGRSIWIFTKLRTHPRIALIGLIGYAFGFVLWNIDNNFCGQLRYSRSVLPGMTRPMTQLHAWWHILAGGASYSSLLYQANLRLSAISRNYTTKWYYRVFPAIRSRPADHLSKNTKTAESLPNMNANNNIYHHGFSKMNLWSDRKD